MSTDTQARDEQEFEACWLRYGFNQVYSAKEMSDFKCTWKAALAAERARSKSLVEALEKIEKYHGVTDFQNRSARDVLKQYRGEG